MKLKESLEKKERSAFDLSTVLGLWTNAVVYREQCGWNEQAEYALKVKTNDLPFDKTLKSLEKWEGKWYVDNWIEKSLRFAKARLLSAEVIVDLRNDSGVSNKSIELMENEINYSLAKFNFVRETDEVIDNHFYYGMGASRQAWNPDDIDAEWRTGKPKLEAIDDTKVWIDPATRKPDKSDMRYLFHREQFDTEELKKMFPDKAKKIEEIWAAEYGNDAFDVPEQPAMSKGVTNVVIYQYKALYPIEKRAIVDENAQKVKYFMEDDYQEYINQTPLDNTMADGLAKEYDENEVFPEAVVATDKIKVNQEFVFQAIFIPELNLLLQEPEYVGKEFTYVFMPGFSHPDKAYSFGWVYYLKDLLEASIVMMTIQLINTVKTNKPIPVVPTGALENEEDFMKNYYKLGATARPSSKWMEEHPGMRPIWFITPPQVSQMHLILQDKINLAIKEFTNSIDSARGIPEYSGMSGRQTGMLQVASTIMSRPEFFKYKEFLRKHCEILKDYLSFYRCYEHSIRDMDENGNPTLTRVNSDSETLLESEGNYVVVDIVENTEALKQLRQQQALGLFERQLLTKEDALRMQELPNTERLVDNLSKQDEMMQLAQAVNENPELKAMIIEYMQTGSIGGQSQEPTPNKTKQSRAMETPR